MFTDVTNYSKQRIQEHYSQRVQKHLLLANYRAYCLRYFEPHKYINYAIAKEKEIKGWVREKKMKLINKTNPSLKLLNEEIFGVWAHQSEKK